MVYFTCNHCGDSLKKIQVIKHTFRCAGTTFSCMDCSKDFTTSNHRAHTKCVTEKEKYAKKGDLPKVKNTSPAKGEKKQEEVHERLRNAMETIPMTPQVKDIISQLTNFENIPTKKQKFENFFTNCKKIKDPGLIQQVWSIVATAVDGNDNDSNKSKNEKDSKDKPSEETKEGSEKNEKKKSENAMEPRGVNEEGTKTKKKKEKKSKKAAESKSLDEERPHEDKENGDHPKKSKKHKKKKKEGEETAAVNGAEEKTKHEDLQNGEREKKKSKKRKKEKEKPEVNEAVVENVGQDAAEPEAAKETENSKKKKTKKRKHEEATEGGNEEKTGEKSSKKEKRDEKPLDSETPCKKVKPSKYKNPEEVTGGKFKWNDIVSQILQTAEAHELSFKKLKKKVFSEYSSRGYKKQMTKEEVGSKLLKKVEKNPCFRYHKERVKLISVN